MYNENGGGGSFAEGYAIGRDTSYNGGMFGGFGNGDGAWWIILLLLAGWGNNGIGNGNNSNFAYELGKVATTNDVASGFNNSAVLSNLNDLRLGQASLQQTLCQGFNGVNTSILTQGNALSAQLASCCCETQRAIDGVNYNMSKGFCDVIRSGQDNTQRILDYLTNNEIAKLREDKAALTAQLSQNAQTSTLINTLRPVAQPAYITCSPYESIFGRPAAACCPSVI